MTASGSAEDAVATSLTAAGSRLRGLGFLARIALGLALAGPVLAYVLYVALYGVDAPNMDDFNTIPVVHDLFTGRLTFGDLWLQQNEHRFFTTLLLVELPVAYVTHFNLHATMLAGAALLVVTTGLLVAAYLRSGAPIWAAVPVVALLFSLIQYANALFAAENWYVALLGVAATLFFLEGSDERPRFYWIALAIAVLTSFSELQGLFVWASAIPYLISGRRTVAQRTIWAVAAVSCAVVFFIGFQFSPQHVSTANVTPELVPYMLLELGALFTGPISGSAQIGSAVWLGLLVAAFAALAIWAAWRTGWNTAALRLPLSLSTFGLVNVVATACGRASVGLPFATSSRYTTYTLVLVAGIYMILERAYAMKPTMRAALILAACCFVIGIQVAASAAIGWPAGAALERERQQSADVLVNYRMADDDVIEKYLWCCPELVRRDAANLERDGLSVFASPRAGYYRYVGIAPLGTPAQALAVPEPIADTIAGDDLDRRAWSVLSAAYASSDLLRATFVASDAATPELVLRWAALEGVSEPQAALFLEPYIDVYGELDSQVREAGSASLGATGWHIAAPFSFDASRIRLSVAPGTDQAGPAYAGSPTFVVVPGHSYRITANIDARSLLHGRACIYPAAKPSGLGLGMECVTPGSRRKHQLVFTAPSGTYGVQWAAVVSDLRIGKTPMQFTQIRVEPVTPKKETPDSPLSDAGLDDPTGRSRWFLPANFSLDVEGRRIIVTGTGSNSGNLYSGSEALSVLSGRTYAISADVDARSATKRDPCFYLAELPSGLGIGMTCARAGTSARLTTDVRIEQGVWLAQWVAFTNDTTIAEKRTVTYSNIRMRLVP